jgi:hypothetical protein
MIIIYIILIIIIFYIINNLLNKEHFYITTWTPYIIDNQYQPAYSNYFYRNGYMYPVY